MKKSNVRKKVVEEIEQIPEDRLPQIWDLIHHFRIGLQFSGKETPKGKSYAGCWKDMPEDIYQDFMNELTQRRHSAFSGRRNRETHLG